MGETRLEVGFTPPANSGINGLADLRPGDLCFMKIGGFVPGVVPVGLGQLMLNERVRIGRLSFDHVLIVTEAAGQDYWTDADGEEHLTPPLGVQAMPDGAEEIELTAERHWTDETVYCRLVEDWPGQALDAANIARAMVAAGVDYSFASYLMLALWRFGLKTPRLEKWINRRRSGMLELPRWSSGPPLGTPAHRGGQLPAEAICSVLADQAWTLAGKRVMVGVPRQVVTPGALAVQLWQRRGVVWGGAGILG